MEEACTTENNESGVEKQNASAGVIDDNSISMQVDEVDSSSSESPSSSFPKDDSGISTLGSKNDDRASEIETNDEDASSLSSTVVCSNGLIQETVSDFDIVCTGNDISRDDNAVGCSVSVGYSHLSGNDQVKEMVTGALEDENGIETEKKEDSKSGCKGSSLIKANSSTSDIFVNDCEDYDMSGIEISEAACTPSYSKGKGSRSKIKRTKKSESSPKSKTKTNGKDEEKTDDVEADIENEDASEEVDIEDKKDDKDNVDSLSSLTSSTDDEEQMEENTNFDGVEVRTPDSRLERMNRRKRRRRFTYLSSSNTSSSLGSDHDDMNVNNGNREEDDDNAEDGDDLETTDSNDEELDSDILKITTDILDKVDPLPNWFAVHELEKREYGYAGRHNPYSFNRRVQGSIQMARRLQLKESLKYHEGCVNSLCFNRIGTLLASGSDDLNVVLWNWEKGRPSLVYESGHRGNVFQAKFMPYSGDCHVVSCARDGQVRLAELSLTGVCKSTRKLAQHRGATHKLALDYDSANNFLSCGEDAVTYLFDLREERPHRLVTTKEKEKKVPLYTIHSNPSDSHQFCVGGRDHFIRVYDKRKIAEDVDGGVMKKLCPEHFVDNSIKAEVTCACYNYNGTEILCTYNDEDIYLFNNSYSDGANYIHRYQGHRNNSTVKGVNFYGPKSEFIVSGSDCGHLYVWEKETEAIINFLEGDTTGVMNVIEPHPTLPIMASSGLDHDIKLWWPSQADPQLDTDTLKKTIQTNQMERKLESVSEPNQMSGQMLWMIMHHFRNTARRRLREEGLEMSSSDDDLNGNDGSDSDADEMNQCATS